MSRFEPIHDSSLQFHMGLYQALLEKKFEQTQAQRRRIQKLINDAAQKIQKNYRRHLLKKRTKAALKIQRWWGKQMSILGERKQKIKKFKSLFYGLIIYRFLKRRQQFSKKEEEIKCQMINKRKIFKCQPILNNISFHFQSMIGRKSALLAELSYIAKYRQYLRTKFSTDWQQYEKRVTEQLWKQINKKWVPIPSNKPGLKAKSKIYLNETEKEVDAEKYISRKLDNIYEEFHEKIQAQDLSLQLAQDKLRQGIQNINQMYIQCVLRLPQ